MSFELAADRGTEEATDGSPRRGPPAGGRQLHVVEKVLTTIETFAAQGRKRVPYAKFLAVGLATRW